MRVLVAEDNPAMCNVFAFNLKRAGWDVTAVKDGVEAARMLAEQPYDVLLTDLQMPGMGGKELCQFAREHLKLTSLKILLCSAMGLETDIARVCVEYDISEVITKPFSPSTLVSTIRGLMPAESIPA